MEPERDEGGLDMFEHRREGRIQRCGTKPSIQTEALISVNWPVPLQFKRHQQCYFNSSPLLFFLSAPVSC